MSCKPLRSVVLIIYNCYYTHESATLICLLIGCDKPTAPPEAPSKLENQSRMEPLYHHDKESEDTFFTKINQDTLISFPYREHLQ